MTGRKNHGSRVRAAAIAAAKRVRSEPSVNRVAAGAARSLVRAINTGLAHLVLHLPRTGVVEVALPNGRIMRLYTESDDDGVANAVFWQGWAGHEPATSVVFWRLAEQSGVVFDVGAHVGYYALLAAHANPKGTVLAFEPLPATAARLRQNVTLNDAASVRCIDVAIGDRVGTTPLYYDPTHLSSTATTSVTFAGAHGSAAAEVDVVVATLDSYAAEAGAVDLVKIDCEGGELAVLHGMSTILDRHRPAIVIELLTDACDIETIADVVAAHEYLPFLLTPVGPLPEPRLRPHPSMANHLLLPAETAAATLETLAWGQPGGAGGGRCGDLPTAQ